MLASRGDNKRFVQWSAENTALLLSKRFPNHNIWIILPSQFYLNTFASYNNFVPSDKFGVPEPFISLTSLSFGNSGVCHLVSLLKNFSSSLLCSSQHEKVRLNLPCTTIIEGDDNDASRKWIMGIKDVISGNYWKLVGFSKGCMVLNQFAHEFSLLTYLREPTLEVKSRMGESKPVKPLAEIVVKTFFENITAMYWLDGGHSGPTKRTWITDPTIVKNFVKNIYDRRICNSLAKIMNIEVHVTPYQIKCAFRPWIGEEEAQFSLMIKSEFDANRKRIKDSMTDEPSAREYLHKLDRDLSFVRKVHFEEILPSTIDTHFELLTHF
ncbi:unnamed protein product [Gordionus sp. m RMFG-2023]